jgi:hypothetical protein
VLFAVNTGLRPDETWRLQFRDVTIVDDEDLDKTILEIEVRGKRGVGYCKSMPGAVRPFERLRSRLRPPRVYGVNTPAKMSMTSVALSEQWRTPGPTDLRLMEGADIYQIAKNCRTSVEMIEKYYAAHIKTSLDAAVINVLRTRKSKKGKRAVQNTQASPQPPEQETDVKNHATCHIIKITE